MAAIEKAQVIFNRKSGAGEACCLLPIIDRDFPFNETVYTDFFDPNRSIDEEAEVVVAVGGDGSNLAVAEVVRTSDSTAPVQFIQAGTFNSAVRGLGLGKVFLESSEEYIKRCARIFDLKRFVEISPGIISDGTNETPFGWSVDGGAFGDLRKGFEYHRGSCAGILRIVKGFRHMAQQLDDAPLFDVSVQGKTHTAPAFLIQKHPLIPGPFNEKGKDSLVVFDASVKKPGRLLVALYELGMAGMGRESREYVMHPYWLGNTDEVNIEYLDDGEHILGGDTENVPVSGKYVTIYSRTRDTMKPYKLLTHRTYAQDHQH